MELPKRYDPLEAEPRWQKHWAKHGIFRFDPDAKGEIFSIDTPPPTVSGAMHLGHAFSYSQEDFIARYQRMRGKNVFYPFGTDDNGLPTQRLIEKTKKVKAEHLGREKFRQLCIDTLEKDIRPKIIADWKRIGMSCDFDSFYTTINDHCRRISQKSFLDLYKAGREYRADAPAMWCTHCKTAISQVECQDAERDSVFNEVVFRVDGKDLKIATTRPELIPGCVAMFAHPDDKRYKSLFGKKAKVPLFDYEVPIMPSSRVDPEKGTGILMCCTFGDQDDVEHYLEHKLPLRICINKKGLMNEKAGKYAGMKILDARKEIISDLQKEGLLTNQEPIKHTLNVHERCGTEIQILHSKQWFIKYLDLKEDMLKWGKELKWFPPHMRVRYENWVNGLRWDWCISRQIFFGIQFPVWYCDECDLVLLANEKDLPVDPISDNAPFSNCPKCGSDKISPETDIINTWATSSLTPILAADLYKDHPIRKKLFPMTLRPQAHDIITFWLFNTVVKSQLHYGKNPWRDVVISGHALDPKGKKMSKSKGNAVEPQKVMEQYGADSLRFWAAGSKLGDDLPYLEKDLVTGKKFITKLWNASKFALMHLEDYSHNKTELRLMDRWLLSRLHRVVKSSTASFDKYEYVRTKADTEKFFWQDFCDNYLEISKGRLYSETDKEGKLAAQHTLYEALLSVLKLMAPITPFITEEIYQLYFAEKEGKRSVHLSSWPEPGKVDEAALNAGDVFVAILAQVRKHKSEKSMSLKTELAKLTIECEPEVQKQLDLDDMMSTTKALKIEFGKGDIECSESVKISIE